MKFKVNFSESSSDLLPEGSYLVSIFDVTEGTSMSGNKKLTLKFEIQEGKYVGKFIWDYISLSRNAVWRLQKFVHALGLPSTNEQEIDTDEWIGKKLIVLVRRNTYQGRENLKVTDFKAYEKDIKVEGKGNDENTKEEIKDEIDEILN